MKQIRLKYNGSWTMWYDMGKEPKELYDIELEAVEILDEMSMDEYKEYKRKMEEPL